MKPSLLTNPPLLTNPSIQLEKYHQLQPIATPWGALLSKKGVKGFPRLHPALMLLMEHIPRAALQVAHLVDSSDSAGIGLLTPAAKVSVIGISEASLRCARANHAYHLNHPSTSHPSTSHPNATIFPAANWQLEADSADIVLHLPSSDRGTARVQAELEGITQSLKLGGCAYLVMHKEQGAKRYEKMAGKLLGECEIIAKQAGWRLSQATKTKETNTLQVEDSYFAARGFQLQAAQGVFAAGKLDKGSALLLDTLELADYQGQKVLDIGCGYGILSLELARAGANITALDDDYLAVQSCHANIKQAGLAANILHSDVNSALEPEEEFDAVIMNPPFHLGKQVTWDIPLAFLATAQQYLQRGGRLIFVANQALNYEKYLDASDIWRRWRYVRQEKGFKILQAWR